MKSLISALACSCCIAAVAHSESYFGTYGGLNWDDVADASFVDQETGFAIGGVLGTELKAVPGLRLELDASFRQNEVELFGGAISADHDTFALMGNVAYDFPTKEWPVHPYVLAGVGYAYASGTFEDIALAKVEASGFAWQVGAGINAPIADGVTLGVGYRYLQAPEIEVLGVELSDGGNHSVVAELKVAL